MSTLRSAVPVAFALLFAISCGKSPDGPPTRGPALEIIAGAGVSDTIQATPSRGLVVRVRGPTGEPESGVTVMFAACPGSSSTCSRMLLDADGSGNFANTASTTADANGRAAVRMRMGTLAGPGFVRITVPVYGLADSVAFIVRPGAAVDVRASLRDTTLDLGSTFTARGGLVDRAGNLRSDPVTFEAASLAVQVSGTGFVSARAIGRAYVRMRGTFNPYPGFTSPVVGMDSVGITVVPKARLAVDLGDPTLESLAGGAARRLSVSKIGSYPGEVLPVYGIVWSPRGDRLAYFTSSGYGGWAVGITDTLGQATALATPGVANTSFPEYSRDGLWIYFHGENGHGTQVFRAHPDGTGLEALQSPTPSDTGFFASPSPDGTRFAYTNYQPYLLVKTLATGRVDTLTTTGFTSLCNTRWSPDGNWIAFADAHDGAIGLVRPDGSGVRKLGGNGRSGGLAWSPDSKWLVAASGQLELVDVAAGTFYRTTTPGFGAAWHP